MIYLDNAATTYPKPQRVYKIWQHAMSAYGANPGRSGHTLSARTAQAVYESRNRCARLFGAEPEQTIFALNCTLALNMAIKGVAARAASENRRPHFVISDMEHNAVLRPVHSAARQYGGSYSIFEATEDEEQTVWNAERAVKPDTIALVCTAASNVIGLRTPIRGLAELCRRKKLCFILDAAQGGGALSLSLSDGVNILCAAGHKGLYGPMGTGLMITDGTFPLETIVEGGTGSASDSLVQPDFTPDRFESGTINTAGVIALGAGVDFVTKKGTAAILSHELALCERFCGSLKKSDGITLYNDINAKNAEHYAPVVSFNIRDIPSVEAAGMLSRQGIYMRGGLHCAPLAHRKAGTIDGGTVRFSPSVFTTEAETDAAVRTIRAIAAGII